MGEGEGRPGRRAAAKSTGRTRKGGGAREAASHKGRRRAGSKGRKTAGDDRGRERKRSGEGGSDQMAAEAGRRAKMVVKNVRAVEG